MQVDALRPYERSLLTGAPLRLRHADGRVTVLDVERWLGPADDADLSVVRRATGPALDVGCGPGRIVAALAAQGMLCLGIDIAEVAVALTGGRGLNVLRRDVFAHLPGEGRWGTVVLLDGNIGIGGDPLRLLARSRALLAPGGRVLVETAADDAADEQLVVRFTHADTPIGPSFPWAHVGADALPAYASAACLGVSETWTRSGRSFSVLEPAAAAAG